jgi:alpha,alpha-trehalase
MIEVNQQETLQRLLSQEDTDGDRRITTSDRGPKRFQIGEETVEGTYALSNLLQELALAGPGRVRLELARIDENPLERISRTIRDRCWTGLTRCLDRDSLAKVLPDPKFSGCLRLYLGSDAQAWEYYQGVEAELIRLPDAVTPEYVLGLNKKPGAVGMAFEHGLPLPYAVPGGRFNEMYGWDSYFIALGLVNDGHTELARAMLIHQCCQIETYGKILNANRTYYLTRSQPPLLTSFASAVGDLDLMRRVTLAAIHEYDQVWQHPTRLRECGLSRYCGAGIGFPPESEMRHYGTILQPYADVLGMSVQDYRSAYERREVGDPALDAYFREDRAVRESGHDTSYRLENVCTHLCPVDLNSMLYRYETDIASNMERYWGGQLEGHCDSRVWRERARLRRQRMTELCWDEAAGQFFDYDWKRGEKTRFESCTNLFPLWAGLATPDQARAMVERGLPVFECQGGLVSGSERSRGEVNEVRTPRQWDYPYGWAPHQMLVWEGLRAYGYDSEASRAAFAWLRMLTQNAVDYNGVLAEKYDVVRASHHVTAEYANVGSEFEYVVSEGFGWTNASYQIGQDYLRPEQLEQLRGIRASDVLS